MIYFKNVELAEKYSVAEGTVRNWIKDASKEKLDLELYIHNGKPHIANTPANLTSIERLVAERKKFRNARAWREVAPNPAFYEIYSPKHILDIITNLTVNGEIPRQYSYFDEGARYWDERLCRQWNEEEPNLLTSTRDLLRASEAAIDLMLEGRKRVNIIDVGPGNGLAAKQLIQHLLKRGVLHRYIAIDISPAILEIAEKNIAEWFDGRVHFEGYIRDISHERFDEILVDDMLTDRADEHINLFLFFGATPMNFRFPAEIIRVVQGNMGPDDLMLYADMVDSEEQRHTFSFSRRPNGKTALAPYHRFILDMLNIDESLYDVETVFSEAKSARYIQIRLKAALTIRFRFPAGERTVELQKGEPIIMLRAWHMTTLGMISCFEQAGLTLLQSNTTRDRQYVLTISGVDRNALTRS